MEKSRTQTVIVKDPNKGNKSKKIKQKCVNAFNQIIIKYILNINY